MTTQEDCVTIGSSGQQTVRPGDYTGLASDYARYRAGYCPLVMHRLLDLLGKPPSAVRFVDVGAGTGIWTRMVCRAGVSSVVAIEPNCDMRARGIADSHGLPIRWLNGTAERTGLPDRCCDWLSMASAFHWADFDEATAEFHRVLSPGGYFTALWNPRIVERNPLLMEIESQLYALRPDLTRVSSGRSGVAETMTARLRASRYFDEVTYLEGEHAIAVSPERYLGAWRSVNDLRVQLGPDRFDRFLRFVEQRVTGIGAIEVAYLTRAWSARRIS
jgi:ubiquinone/menaquinone biosynthesis C-methylase UbiE